MSRVEHRDALIVVGRITALYTLHGTFSLSRGETQGGVLRVEAAHLLGAVEGAVEIVAERRGEYVGGVGRRSFGVLLYTRGLARSLPP